MKTYKSALIAGHFDNGMRLKKVQAKKIVLKPIPNRIIFVHKAYGYFSITEPLSGAKIATDRILKKAIKTAEYKVKNKIPKKYNSFDDFVNDFIYRHNIYPLTVNLKIFA
jgi:hypothetical protein